MPWEKRYYDEWKEQLQTCAAQAEAETASQTAEETHARKKQFEENLIRFLELNNEREKTRVSILNPLKIARFKTMIDNAMTFAEHCDTNICIDWSETSYGTIRLETDFLLLNDSFPDSIRKSFLSLYMNASSFSIAQQNDTFIIQYFYDFRDTQS